MQVHGLIFLFRWRHEKDDWPVATDAGGLFFATQMVHNAAQQAILSILLNTPAVDAARSSRRSRRSTGLPARAARPRDRAVGDRAHCAQLFGRQEAFAVDEKRASEKDDEVTRAQLARTRRSALRRLSSAQVYHFISYVPHEGKLYELDGLKGGPICLGEIDGGADGEHGDWLAAVRPVIQRRIGQYTSKEIRFNLMAVVANRRDRLVDAQARIEKERNMTVGKVQARSGKLPTPEELMNADDHERSRRWARLTSTAAPSTNSQSPSPT